MPAGEDLKTFPDVNMEVSKSCIPDLQATIKQSCAKNYK